MLSKQAPQVLLGFSVCLKLIERGDIVIGIDNHNNYYDPKLKEERVKKLVKYSNYKHNKVDISDQKKSRKYI